MKLKSNVNLKDVQWQLFKAACVVEEILATYRCPCIITSANDGRHSYNSWHYKGRALDFRTKYTKLDGKEHEFCREVARALGPEFDVVLEAVGTNNEHLHVEYDPK